MEWINLIIAVVAMVVSVLAVLFSRRANRISQESVRTSMMPWVKVTKIAGPPVMEDGKAKFHYEIKNFGNGPAIDVLPIVVWRGMEGPYDNEGSIMMPGESGEPVFWVGGYASADAALAAVNSGEAGLGFRVRYSDSFGRECEWCEEWRSVSGTLSIHKGNLKIRKNGRWIPFALSEVA